VRNPQCGPRREKLSAQQRIKDELLLSLKGTAFLVPQERPCQGPGAFLSGHMSAQAEKVESIVLTISHVVGHTGCFSLRPTSAHLEHLGHTGVSHAWLGRLEPLRDQNGFVKKFIRDGPGLPLDWAARRCEWT
jgi:hypothetical protein